MYRIFAILAFPIIISSCSDDENANAAYYSNNTEVNAPDTTAHIKKMRKNEATIEGLTYNIDSVTYKALIQYNKMAVNSICAGIITDIVQKDKKIAFKSEVQTLYAFEISKEDLDSLKYYGFKESDISHTDVNKPIYISGVSPYKEKGLWETVKVANLDYEKNYPELYHRATATFLRTKGPRLTNITVTDQASKYVDYSAEFQYSDDQSVYIYFTVKNVRQQIDITLNKSDS